MAVALVPLAIAARHNPLTDLGEGIAITVPFAAVGVLVARRQPGNVIGWLMISPALFYLLGTGAGLYAVIEYRLGHSLPFGPVALLLYQARLPMVALFPLVILLFPDGRLPSPRWRWVLYAYVGLCCALLALVTERAASVIASGHIQVDANGQLTVFDHYSGWLPDAQVLFLGAFTVLWLSFLASQALSWRRSAGERRQQLKWLLSGAVVCLVSLAVSPGSCRSTRRWRWPPPRWPPRRCSIRCASGCSGAWTGGSTAPGMTANQTVGAFAARLKDAVDLDTVRDDLAKVVQQALEPAHISVWVSRRD